MIPPGLWKIRPLALVAAIVALLLVEGVDAKAPPADFVWPEAIAYLDDDCSLYRDGHRSLRVTVFTSRNSKAFPEFDLPSPVKVGRKLMLLKPARPGVEPKLLLDAGMGAIGSPSASYDGKWIYVSMALEDEAFYHIYRVPAGGGEPQRLTDGPFHDIDPAELPDGRIIFCSTRTGRFEEYHSSPSRAVFTMDQSGKNILPLTHTFIFDNEPEVMADGRVILLRSDNFFDRAKVETMLHAIRPDGTGGQTLFGLDNGPEYGRRLRAFYCGSPAPLPDGRVAFVTNKGITIGMPGASSNKHQRIRVDASGVAALPDGRLLSAVKTGKARNFKRISIIDPSEKGTPAYTLFESPKTYLHSPIYLGARKLPPVLPGRIDSKKANDDVADTGFLFCSNVRFTANTTAGWPHVKAIRVIASKGLTVRSSHSYIVHVGSEVMDLGTVPVAPDGSFSVEVPADTGIAFQAVDAEGRSELNEMSWITVRPGERRGCLGCHNKRDVAPTQSSAPMQAMAAMPARLLGGSDPLMFRGNNPAVSGLMEMQFDRFREVAGINRHQRSTAASGKKAGVAELITFLKGTDTDLKVSSAQRLGSFRDAAAAPALIDCLKDESREVRLAAVMAVATCGTRQSVEPLLAALSDRDPLVAQGASIALENITGHSEAFNPFVRANKRAAEDAKWRDWFAATSFDKIEAELVERMKSKDRDVVRRAAVAMRHIGGDASRQALSEYHTREREVNPYPAWPERKRVNRQFSFNSLSEWNPRTLQAVTRSMGAFKDTETVNLLASTLAKHSDPDSGNLFLAEAVVEALGKIATPEAEAALIKGFAAFGPYQKYSRWYGDHDALIACHASPVHYFTIEALDSMESTTTGPILSKIIQSVPTDPDRALLLYNDDYEILVGRVIRRSGDADTVINVCLSALGDTATPKGARAAEIKTALGIVPAAWAGKPDIQNRAAHILSMVCDDASYEPRIRAALTRYMKTSTKIKRVFTGKAKNMPLPVKNWVCFYLARSLGNLQDVASYDVLLSALNLPPEAASGVPDPTGPGVLFLHNELTPCWRAAVAWAVGEVGDKRAVPTLLKVIKDLDNAPDTRHTAATALGKLADAKSLPAIRALAKDYPEVSTRQALLSILEE